jgi:hypothetical protein
VVSQEFSFALTVSGAASRDMLAELVARVLERAGGPDAGSESLVADLQAAVARASAQQQGQPVDIRFAAAGGLLEIVVSSKAGKIWEFSRALT